MQGFCIEEGHGHNETESSLPSREFFLKDLFKDKEYLSEEDLEGILEVLGIGNAAESHEGDSHDDHGHDDHGHRRRRSAGSNLLPQRRSSKPHKVHRRAADEHGHGETNGANGTVSYDEYLVNCLTVFLHFLIPKVKLSVLFYLTKRQSLSLLKKYLTYFFKGKIKINYMITFVIKFSVLFSG